METTRETKINPASTKESASQWAVAWRRFRRNKAGVVGLTIVLGVVVIGIFGDVMAPYPAFPNYKSLTPFYNVMSGHLLLPLSFRYIMF